MSDYQDRPELASVAKAARAYLLYKSVPDARNAEVVVQKYLGQGAKYSVFHVNVANVDVSSSGNYDGFHV